MQPPSSDPLHADYRQIVPNHQGTSLMKQYQLNEMFYSLQGEGHHTGRAAIFIRFSGCNLACSFCDTDHRHKRSLNAAEVVNEALQLVPAEARQLHHFPMVVLTGGEPTLQADNELVDQLHQAGFDFVAMESNGTCVPPSHLDWFTVSPKEKVTVTQCDELKCLFDGVQDPEQWNITARYRSLQPLDTGQAEENARLNALCADYVKCHPQWRLSLQTHKWLGIR